MMTLPSIHLMQFFLTLSLGLVVGSFLNVVIARLPQGRSIVRPPSHCPQCQTPIRWYDNVPVFSWLVLLRGKCRSCKAAISARYPLVELLTALLFLASWSRFGWNWSLWLRDWPLMAALVAVTFIDLDLRIIPDEISLGGLVWGLLTCFLDPRLGVIGALAGAALGFGVFYGFAWVYWFLTKRSGLGGGDIKLLAMLGAFVGVGGVFSTILISSVLGSVIGILTAVVEKRRRKGSLSPGLPSGLSSADGESVPTSELQASDDSVLKTAIPYGPFLVIGAISYHLLGDAPWFPFTIPM